AATQTRGSAAFSVADPYESDQLILDLYYGETTPGAKETPHWHAVQTEAYIVMEGEAEFFVKWRWTDNGWQIRVARAGDIVLMQRQRCNWLRWRSTEGRAAVFKAPQIPGVGKPPNGKQTCLSGCPHYKRGCVLPEGFNPELARK